MKYFLTLSLTFLFINACNTHKERIQNNYFNILNMLKADIATLYKNKAILIKVVKSGAKADNIKMKKPDWNLELEFFNKLNISSPELEGKYRVDTTIIFSKKQDSTIIGKRIIYTATEDELPVQELVVEFNSDKVLQHLTGKTVITRFLKTVTKTYDYTPLTAFSVNAEEMTKWFGTSTYSVEGTIYFEEPYFQ